jgi:capsular exopolysaccharide synthesis family protein
MQQPPAGSPLGPSLEASAQLAQTFVHLITIRPVLQDAITTGGLNMSVTDLAESLDVTLTRDSQLIEIAATANDPVRARDITTNVARAFIESDEAQAAPRAGLVSIVEPAVAPENPVSPRRSLNAALGSVLGLIIAGLLLQLREYLDDSLSSPAQVEALGLKTLGQLRDFGSLSAEHQLQVASFPQSKAAEEYRGARAALTAALGQDETGKLARNVVLIASPSGGEGTSATAANLAVMFGSAEYRVLLIDANLREPVLHALFSLQNGPGLTSHLLSGDAPAIHHVDITRSEGGRPVTLANIGVLTAGPTTANPAELLGSPRMRATLSQLAEQYDLVLVDSPPVLERSDAAVLASMVDSVVIVVRAGRTRARDLHSTARQLAGPGRQIDGVILTQSRGMARLAAPTSGSQPLGTARPGDVDPANDRLQRVRR